MGDEWEALFDLWHQRAHGPSIKEKRRLFSDLEDLEARIVKLEAWQKSLQEQIAREARLG